VGVLSRGKYFLGDSEEIGEGGISIVTEFVLAVDSELVLNIQIPGGDFVSVRACVKSVKKIESARVAHGLSFENLPFNYRRQIRSFVSARLASQGAAA